MNRADGRLILWALVLALLAVIISASVGRASVPSFLARVKGEQRVWATSYSTSEHLTGCVSPGRCGMACGGYLNDARYTIAANFLPCGKWVVICGKTCHPATVTDRTGYHGIEMSVALALATGQTRATWADPHLVVVRS